MLLKCRRTWASREEGRRREAWVARRWEVFVAKLDMIVVVVDASNRRRKRKRKKKW